MAKTRKFDTYLAEARTAPFELEVSAEETISIPHPDGETMLLIEESQSARRTLSLLCGDHYTRVNELIGKAPAGVLMSLVIDMIEHFGLNRMPPGGSAALPR